MPKTQSNDINLYYEVNGKGQPLLFIHGLGSIKCPALIITADQDYTPVETPEPFNATLTEFLDKHR